MPSSPPPDGPVDAATSHAELLEEVAAVVAVPRRGPTDSFTLHAPLEVLARAGLLVHLAPDHDDVARQRLAWVGTTFAATGTAWAPASAIVGAESTSAAVALARLAAAVDAGEVDDADGWLEQAARTTSAEELSAGLAAVVLPRLAGAGHGAIALHLLPRVAPRSPAATGLLRGIVRELARAPERQLTWFHDRRPEASATDGGGVLEEVLRRPASPGDPGSTFIDPTMSLVERSGLATELLAGPTGGLAVGEARRVLLRTAARSMLQDDPAHAPYGWTHCLTMPQATLSIARSCPSPADAVAVAATWVLGFRATLGGVDVAPRWVPAPDAVVPTDELLEHGPASAASTIWHAPPTAVPELVRTVVATAAVHEDAHLAKYALACLDATRDDPGAGRLYLAAAAYLAAWWRSADLAAAALV